MTALHKYTQAEFDALPIVDGRKICPTGDYSRIESFPEWCSFGEWCSFENGKKTRTENPYFAVDRIGSELRKTYFFDFKDGIYVRAGCFGGPVDEFVAKLEADNDDHKTKVYLAALALAKMQLGVTS